MQPAEVDYQYITQNVRDAFGCVDVVTDPLRQLFALVLPPAAAQVPRLDHLVIGWLADVRQHHLVDVDPEIARPRI